MSFLKQIASELSACSSIVVATHTSPDPDAIGSSCGLALGLQSLGKNVTVYLGDQVPRIMKALVPGVKIVTELPTSKVEALVVVDTASRTRIGGDGEGIISLAQKSFNIDHHISNDSWAEFNFINAERSSCAEIVLEILEEMNATFSPECSNLLFAGVMDDTGSFRFRNTAAATFEHAARLVKSGASPQHVSNLIYFSVPPHVVKLRARALSGLKFSAEGRVAIVAVTQNMLTECGATAEDTDGLVEEARAMDGVIVAVFMRELAEGWKFSLRSKVEAVDVNAVAAKFGGGGHKAAAGCRVVGSQDETLKAVLASIEAALSRVN